LHDRCVAFEGIVGFIIVAFWATLLLGFSIVPFIGRVVPVVLMSDIPYNRKSLFSQLIGNTTADWLKASGFEQYKPLHEAFQDNHNQIMLEASENYIG
jgi:hypothetical protein